MVARVINARRPPGTTWVVGAFTLINFGLTFGLLVEVLEFSAQTGGSGLPLLAPALALKLKAGLDLFLDATGFLTLTRGREGGGRGREGG